MDASDLQLLEEDEEEARASGIGDGSAAEKEATQALPRNRSSAVKHTLHTTTSHSKHHRSLSTSSTSSPPPPLTALTPSSSATSLIRELAGQLDQLNDYSQSTVHGLRSTAATPSLLPTFQHTLDEYQLAFSTAASQLSAPIRTLSSHYSDRLEGAADECRSLSYRVSNSLSQLSSSAAGTASERIHSVYSAYRSLQSEHDNCQLLLAVATQLQTLLERLRAVNEYVKVKSWEDALDALDAVHAGGDQLLAFDPHMATSVVYRRLLVIPQHDTHRLCVRCMWRVMTQKPSSISARHSSRLPVSHCRCASSAHRPHGMEGRQMTGTVAAAEMQKLCEGDC